MQAARIISKIELSSGDVLTVDDQTKVYFGDYYHVKLDIKGVITTAKSAHSAVYHRVLEKMAVPSVKVASAIEALLFEFGNCTLPYLNSPDFAEKYIAMSTAKGKAVIQRSPWTITRA